MALPISRTFIPAAPKPTAAQRNAALEEQLNERDRTATLSARLAAEPVVDLGPGGAGGTAPAPAAPAFMPAYMPPRSGIGTGGKPKAWSAPQQNFEDALARGEVDGQKIAQAQAFAAANGRVFDATLGYSVNKTLTPAPKPAIVPTPPTPTSEAPPPPRPEGAREQPTGYGQDGLPIYGQQALVGPPKPKPAPNFDVAHVFDGGKPVLTQAAQQNGVAGYDQYGGAVHGPVKPKPKVGFATGTLPGERTPTDRPFTINELPGQQEVMTMEDGTQVIPPPGPRTVRSPVPLQVTPTFAPSSPPSARAPRVPLSAEFRPTPPTARAAPDFGMPAPQRSPSPAFVPSFAPTMSAPPGVRKTDFRRFLKTPAGLQFALGNQAQQQSAAANTQTRQAQLTMQRDWQLEDRDWQLEDRDQAKAERAASDAEDSARWDAVAEAMTEGGSLFTAADKALIARTQGVKAKQSVLDTLSRLRMQEREDKAAAAKEVAKRTQDEQDFKSFAEVPGNPNYLMNRRGQMVPKPQTFTPLTEAQIRAAQAAGADVTVEQGGATLRYPGQTGRLPSAPVVRNFPSGADPDGTPVPHQWDGKGWVPIQTAPAPGAAPTVPASRAANNRYFPNSKPQS